MNIPNHQRAWPVFLLHPFSSLLLAIRNYREPWAKNLVWAFVAFYGFTMVTSDTGLDSSRYKEQFLLVHNAMRSRSADIGEAILMLGEGKLDLFQPVLTAVIAWFTGDASVLFLVLAIVYGYFYSRNIWFLLEHVTTNLRYAWVFALAFAVVIGFWEINGFRMWTAAHVFFFGAIRYLLSRKIKWLLFVALTPLIHFSFAVPLVCLVVFALAGARKRLFFLFYVVSLLIQSVNLEAVNAVLKSYVAQESTLDKKVSGYLNEDYAVGVKAGLSGRSLHAALYQSSLKVVVAAFLFLFLKRFEENDETNNLLKRLYSFVLLFMGVANILSSIPSGGRFVQVANLFAVCLVALYLSRYPVTGLTKKLAVLSVPLLLFFTVISIRVGFDTMSVQLLAGNPLTALLFPYDLTVISLIK